MFKKLKKYSFIAIITLSLLGCEDNELVSINTKSGSIQTFIKFSKSTSPLDVNFDTGVGSIEVGLDVSTASDTDRTVNLSLVSTDAPDGSFSFPSTVTIPAGSYNTSFVVEGVKVNDLTTATNQINIKIDSFTDSNTNISSSNHTVEIKLVCPIGDLYKGNYRITVNSPGVFGAGTYGADGTVVELREGATPTQRVFDADYFNDSRFNREFILNFVCNSIEIPYQDHAVGCGGNDVNLSTGPSSNKGSYNTADDTSFTVILTDNVDSDCGGGPVEASYTFTKM